MLELLAFLNMTCLLLGTTGGFGAIFAYFVSSQIRAYNRISVFIAFFAILTVCWVLNEFFNENKRATLSRISKVLFSSIMVLLIFVDQVPQLSLNQNLASLESNKTFVRQLETVLPPNALIFQLPYMTFPEHPVDLYPMFDYDLFKPYLLSTRLRWSYGGIKGREANEWYRSTAQLPLESLVTTISKAGFSGIYIDRYGYKELENNAVEQKLQKLLMITPIVSPDQRLAFYDLRAGPDSLSGGSGWH
jgi:phosphoglycerol transferase